jgi:excisionase family DNA binding protein
MLEDLIRSILRDELRAAVRDELRSVLEELRVAAPNPEQEFLSVKQAARMAAVSAGTVRSWLQRGQLRRFGEGRVVRVRREDLVRLLAASDGETPEASQSWDQQAAELLQRRRPA